MDVNPGYKQAEVGVIPEDWEVKSVHEFGVITTGPFGTLLNASGVFRTRWRATDFCWRDSGRFCSYHRSHATCVGRCDAKDSLNSSYEKVTSCLVGRAELSVLL